MADSGFAEHLILDSGAVIALSRHDERARAYLTRALELGLRVHVPVPVVAETVRGNARDAPVHRVLNAIDSIPAATERVGRRAGQLPGQARSDHTVDALVVAQALELPSAIVLTGDPGDLERLATKRPNVLIQDLNQVI